MEALLSKEKRNKNHLLNTRKGKYIKFSRQKDSVLPARVKKKTDPAQARERRKQSGMEREGDAFLEK